MSRILFIRPVDSTVAEVTPPIGVLFVASVLRKRLGAKVRVIDAFAEGIDEREVARRAAAFDPHVIGYTALSCQAPSLHRLTPLVRAACPSAVTVAGGALASTQTADVLADPAIDYAVAGEGEDVFCDLVSRLAACDDARGIAGLSYRNRDAVHDGGHATAIENLDALPDPAVDLVDLDLYARLPRIGTLYRHRRYFSVSTSRGCPYRCTYCHVIHGKRFRYRSAARVLSEIDVLVTRHGVREIQFVDDIFNMRKDRTLAICRGIAARKEDLAISFPNGLRGDQLDEETVDALANAGAYKVSIAIESGTERIQREMKKNMKLDRAARAIDLLAARRVMTHGFFMLGFPGETREDMEQTVRFARSSRLHSASFFFVQPLPGSELHAQFVAAGAIVPNNDALTSYYDGRMAGFTLAKVDASETRRLIRRATLAFYASPRRLFRIARDLPCRRQLAFAATLAATRLFLPRQEGRLLARRRRAAAVTPA